MRDLKWLRRKDLLEWRGGAVRAKKELIESFLPDSKTATIEASRVRAVGTESEQIIHVERP